MSLILSRVILIDVRIIEASGLQEAELVLAFRRCLVSGAMAKCASEIVSWELIEDEMSKSERVAGARESALDLENLRDVSEKLLVKQLSTETLLTELKRRCDGSYMGNWKLSLTS